MWKEGGGRKNITVSSLWLAGQGKHGAVDLEEEERKGQREVSCVPGSGFRLGASMM